MVLALVPMRLCPFIHRMLYKPRPIRLGQFFQLVVLITFF